jgi:hypothetical protein
MAFKENEAGRRENLRGFSTDEAPPEPAILPLRFLPNPNDIERRDESIDCLGLSPPTPPDMLTGGYLFCFSCILS